MELLTAKEAHLKSAEHNSNKTLLKILSQIEKAIQENGVFEIELSTDNRICPIICGKLSKLGYKIKEHNGTLSGYITIISW